VANLPAKRLSLAEKSALFTRIGEANNLQFEKLKEILKLNPMNARRVTPKVQKMVKTMRVMTHKGLAMAETAKKEKPDVVAFERHLDRAIAAAELLNGILDDTIRSASA
jgi:hypothetical protein